MNFPTHIQELTDNLFKVIDTYEHEGLVSCILCKYLQCEPDEMLEKLIDKLPDSELIDALNRRNYDVTPSLDAL